MWVVHRTMALADRDAVSVAINGVQLRSATRSERRSLAADSLQRRAVAAHSHARHAFSSFEAAYRLNRNGAFIS